MKGIIYVIDRNTILFEYKCSKGPNFMELLCERTIIFGVSRVPCQILSNIATFCLRSGPTTKSYDGDKK